MQIQINRASDDFNSEILVRTSSRRDRAARDREARTSGMRARQEGLDDCLGGCGDQEGRTHMKQARQHSL